MNVRSFGSASLVVVALASVATSVSPAPTVPKVRINAAMAVHQDEQSLQEHVNQLEMQMQALQAQVAADEAKLKEADDTANQAKTMAGFINVGLTGQVKNLNASIEGVQAGLASTNAALGDLSTRYGSHTHQFNSFTFQFHADGSVTNGQYHSANTLPPNH